ncbi:chymotrypsin-2-like [Camponotus floridanus]|uniref:chymotrypsin-2-like n=1 Tax=Camponotus floridanus TaxID=104421 RepID=UPI000DC69A4C|nr:chymotrypsin-2-like [Camponotus floridanus]
MNSTALCLLIILILGIISYGGGALRVRRLIGGVVASESEFPYQVSLRYYDVHICSGVLINDRYVLSAAHCICNLIDEPSEELNVLIGSVDYKKGEIHTVKSVKCHPDYVYGADSSWVADLAVIMLAEKVHLSSHVKPISLATYNTTFGERAIISGWGRTRLLSWLSQYLQKLSVSIIDNKACQKYYKDITILSSQICTLERKNVGACKGDSGSPLVYNNKLIGIFSWTKSCAIGFPDVFTRISYFTDFITQAMLDLDQSNEAIVNKQNNQVK